MRRSRGKGEAFIEQLLVRRELAVNFVHYTAWLQPV
jgi:hypothetical protein